MIIRSLQPDDAAALLAFELDNRDWFEQHVAARAPAFYTLPGVTTHITEYLDAHRAGSMLPCVLVDADGRIAGRANLRHIDRTAGTAEVGYRIARAMAGRGLASLALGHLLQAARTQYGLTTLDAWISDDNPGSLKVVGKWGFARIEAEPDIAVVGGQESPA
ncbi:MAG: GNAT family N-acetyltransferase [Duganella sp.]